MRSRRAIIRAATGAIVPAVLLLAWHFASASSVVVPSVGAVVDVLAHPFREPLNLDATSLASGAAASVLRPVLCGFALAVATAVPVGLLMGRCRWAMSLFSPTLAAAMVISPVAWMPVAIITFGLASPATVLYGDEARRHGVLDQLRFAILAVVWFGGFIPIVVNTAAGARSVRESYVESARVLVPAAGNCSARSSCRARPRPS